MENTLQGTADSGGELLGLDINTATRMDGGTDPRHSKASRVQITKRQINRLIISFHLYSNFPCLHFGDFFYYFSVILSNIYLLSHILQFGEIFFLLTFFSSFSLSY